MKKNTLILLLALTFTACGGNAYPDEALTENVADPNEFIAITAQEQLDTDTVVAAVRTMNADLCDTVANSDQKANCLVKVSDAVALKSGNCKSIKEENTAKKCDLLKQEEENRTKDSEEIAAEEEKVEKIIEGANLADCESLKYEHTLSKCVIAISMREAAEKQDPAPCENIKDQWIKDLCISDATATTEL